MSSSVQTGKVLDLDNPSVPTDLIDHMEAIALFVSQLIAWALRVADCFHGFDIILYR